jgi:hypothetical protein
VTLSAFHFDSSLSFALLSPVPHSLPADVSVGELTALVSASMATETPQFPKLASLHIGFFKLVKPRILLSRHVEHPHLKRLKLM